MSKQNIESEAEEITLELSPKNINALLTSKQDILPQISLNHQNTILSTLSEDPEPIVRENSKKKKVEQPVRTNICQIHKKPLEVICIDDKCKICTDCAIFGKHSGHSFKRQEDFEYDISQYLEGINAIIQKQSKIDAQGIKVKINKMSNSKKDQLNSKIEKNASNLRKIIDKLELQAKKQVEKLTSLTNFNTIQKLSKLVSEINEHFRVWRVKSSKQMKILESEDLQQKLEVIYNSKQQQALQNKIQLVLFDYHTNVSALQKSQEQQMSLIRVDIDNTIQQKLKNSISITNKIDLIIPQLPTLSHYISNGQQLLLETEPHRNLITNIENIKEEQSYGSLDNRSDKFHNSSLSSINVPKMSESFIIDKRTMNDFSFRSDNNKKQKSIKPLSETRILLPKAKKTTKYNFEPKIQKMYDNLVADKLDMLDLTNAELGDAAIEHITQHLSNSKCTSVKLIRNKITDQGLKNIFKYFENVISLNLSQNLLTDASIQFVLANVQKLPKLKNIALSLNKIKERNVREKIQMMKKRGITVSV